MMMMMMVIIIITTNSFHPSTIEHNLRIHHLSCRFVADCALRRGYFTLFFSSVCRAGAARVVKEDAPGEQRPGRLAGEATADPEPVTPLQHVRTLTICGTTLAIKLW